MNGLLKVVRYQLRDAKSSIMIFYAIMLGLVALLVGLTWYGSGEGQVGGLEMSSVIFIFILGLNSFSSGFKFMQANGVSRKRFYLSSIISLVAIATLMAGFDLLIGQLLKQMGSFNYQGMMEQLYLTSSVLADLVWSLALYSFTATLGWLITMVYYRSGKLEKTIISISPVFLFFVFAYVNYRLEGAISRAVVNFLARALGLAGAIPNPYVAALSFLVAAAGVSALSFPVIRRISIKS